MCCMQMKFLFKFNGRGVYYSGKGFKYRGIWYYNGTRNVRLIAFNQFTEWTANTKGR